MGTTLSSACHEAVRAEILTMNPLDPHWRGPGLGPQLAEWVLGLSLTSIL